MNLSSYTGEDGILRQSVNVSVERMEIDSAVVTNIEEPVIKMKASANDEAHVSFEDLYFFVKTSGNVELSAKTDLKKVRKALKKEKQDMEKKEKEEKALAQVGDGDDEDEEDEADDAIIREGIHAAKRLKADTGTRMDIEDESSVGHDGSFRTDAETMKNIKDKFMKAFAEQ